MLTSSISSFFTTDEVDLKEELAKLHKENKQLNEKLDKLEQTVIKKNHV